MSVTARSDDQLSETVKLIEDAGGRAIAVQGDVSDPLLAKRVVSETEQQLGLVDLLVNNAGVSGPMNKAWEVDGDDWWRTVEINLRGPYLFARAVLPRMVERRSGRIINVSSEIGYGLFPYLSSYGCSKAAIAHLTNTLAAEVKEFGIVVLAYKPGFVRTPMAEEAAVSPEAHSDVRAMYQTSFDSGLDSPIEDVVRRFMFLASGRADAFSGRTLCVSDDEADLLSRSEEIQRDDLYTLRLRM